MSMDMARQARTGVALGILVLGLLASMVFRRAPAPTAEAPAEAPRRAPLAPAPAVIEAPLISSHLEGTIAAVDPAAPLTPGDLTPLAGAETGSTAGDLDWPTPLSAEFPEATSRISAATGAPPGAAEGGSAFAPMPAPRPSQAAAIDQGGEHIVHLIADGDTLSNLAVRYLGSASRYLEIYEANREVLKNPDVLPIGRRLRIPPRAIGSGYDPAATTPDAESAESEPLDGEPSRLVPLPSAGARAQSGDGNQLASYSSEPLTYRVKRHDTLRDLARRFLGDANRYQELFAANRDRLASPGDLREGMLLVLP